jgi:hypothetical protein
LRGFSPFGLQRGWHRLITLVCLVAFVFVAAAHAGHHLAPLGDASVAITIGAPVAGGDEADGDGKDTFCVFCALAAAEFPVTMMMNEPVLRARVETRHDALAPSPRPAESPPPIT